jgi:phenol 2-monooxygenase
MPESLTIDVDKVDSDDYPVSVTLRSLPKPPTESQDPPIPGEPAVPNGLYRSNLAADTTDELLRNAQAAEGTYLETVLAKYVVGCDGAHSWTRRQIGSVMEGDQTDYIWSVLSLLRAAQLHS